LIVITLNDIITALTNQEITPLDVPLSGAVIDSREAIEGSLFIALPGENVNGHDYVQAAFDNGAILAFVDRDMGSGFNVLDLRPSHFQPGKINITLPLCLRVENTLIALQTLAAYWRQRHQIRCIGITGSVGKTSTKELTADLLARKYTILKNKGNRNNEIGLPLTLLELDEQHDCAVLEMGFYVPGEIRLLCEIAQPQVGIVTNVGTVHAERAGSQSMIAKGKAELVQSLPDGPQGVAILNMDDPWVLYMFGKTRAKVLSYGIKDDADLSASQIESYGLDGISCVLTYKGEDHKITSPLMGNFSVYTILRATAAALAEGLEWATITTTLAKSQMNLRMRRVPLANGVMVLDDTYNAAPESTIAALELLKTLQGRRVAILGDMLELGQYEKPGHQSVGEVAAETVDVLILVGSRSKITAESAVEHGFDQSKLKWYPESETAAMKVAGLIKKGDIVLIKGSNSMHMDKILNALEESD
jgi:UDP-N-acetylmuramoyl-tripeptide--D-alanyl-D-alanine ligase